jgi:transposase InsO family protein
VRFALVDAEKANYPVAVLCDALEVSRSGYYAWRGRPVAPRARADARLAAQIRATHERSRRTYGSPRVHAELRARGIRVGRKRVERLMRQHGIQARRRRRYCRTTDSRHELPVAPNVLQRRFEADAPNQVWVGDVTYVPTDEGWLFLAVLLDVFSRRAVGWAMSASNDRTLALEALERARRARRPAPGLVHHTDRGSPYASDDYRLELRKQAMVPSMSRTGDCWDNAVAESFFATLKVELVDRAHYATRAAATASIDEYIDGFYNPVRRHSTLDFVSPMEYELKRHVASLAA